MQRTAADRPGSKSHSASWHIGVPETRHSISHHGNDKKKLGKYTKIGIYRIVKLAQFLEKLKPTKDGSGTLFDHSLLYWAVE